MPTLRSQRNVGHRTEALAAHGPLCTIANQLSMAQPPRPGGRLDGGGLRPATLGRTTGSAARGGTLARSEPKRLHSIIFLVGEHWRRATCHAEATDRSTEQAGGGRQQAQSTNAGIAVACDARSPEPAHGCRSRPQRACLLGRAMPPMSPQSPALRRSSPLARRCSSRPHPWLANMSNLYQTRNRCSRRMPTLSDEARRCCNVCGT